MYHMAAKVVVLAVAAVVCQASHRVLRSADNANTAQLCKECDGGDEQSCDKVVTMDMEQGINVCDPNHDHHAARGEYDDAMFQGDIVKGTTGRGALVNQFRHWDGGVVPYAIESGRFTETQIATIKAGIKTLGEKTCLTLKERTNEEYWIKISNTGGSGCFSALGMQAKEYQPQHLNLGAGCLYTIGTTMHEIMHALGFVHEQNRPDRDTYVHIDWTNIYEGSKSQYKKEEWGDVDISNTGYDYGSVMHYGPQGFAIDYSKPVMTPTYSGYDIGQRTHLSSNDITEINRVYNNCNNYQKECKDYDDGCPGWKIYCTNSEHVIASCKKTCGAC